MTARTIYELATPALVLNRQRHSANAERMRDRVTHEADPISRFELKTGDYAEMGRQIASLAIPTAIMMESGYVIEALGPSVAEFLSAY